MSKQWLRFLPCLLVLLGCGTLRADYQTHTLHFTLSNDLADNISYGSVFAEAYDGIGASGGGLNAGEVRFTVKADPNAYSGIGSNFGLQTFGFNTTLLFEASDISGPAGWSVTSVGNISQFGVFSWVLFGDGSNRTTEATVLVSNLGEKAKLDNFFQSSVSNGTELHFIFAAHIAGFDGDPSSHHVGAAKPGSIPIEVPPPPPGGGGGPDITRLPEPSTLALSLFGLGAIGLSGLRKFRRRAATK